MTWQVIEADCVEQMKLMDEASVDAVVTDPPAGISFMGRGWDSDRSGGFVEWLSGVMREALRVTKPGGHALVWALPRTSHWTGSAIEGAGWEIRDRIAHHFGSGFPKSFNLGNGQGTALKPATEDWWLARKPLVGTVAQNVERFGTGALNIDGTRIGAEGGTRKGTFPNEPSVSAYGDGLNGACEIEQTGSGRWPANVTLSHLPECERMVHDDYEGMFNCAPGCPVAELDRQSGEAGGQGKASGPTLTSGSDSVARGHFAGVEDTPFYGDTGGASRFFYVAKAPRAERNAGLEGFEERQAGIGDDRPSGSRWERRAPEKNPNLPRANHHPTVKPIDLMRWLVRLVTPPGGTVLDCFAGSGTTGIAVVLEDFDFIGIERELEYAEIARARIDHWAKQPKQLGLFGGADVGGGPNPAGADEVAQAIRKDAAPHSGEPSQPAVDVSPRPGEASAERRYTESGASNFAMKPGRRRKD